MAVLLNSGDLLMGELAAPGESAAAVHDAHRQQSRGCVATSHAVLTPAITGNAWWLSPIPDARCCWRTGGDAISGSLSGSRNWIRPIVRFCDTPYACLEKVNRA